MKNIKPKVLVIVLREHHGETIIYKTLQEKLAEYAKNFQIKLLRQVNIPSIDDNIRSKEIVYPQIIPCFIKLEKIYKRKGRTVLEIKAEKVSPVFINTLLSVLLNYDGYRAKKQCIDSLKKV